MNRPVSAFLQAIEFDNSLPIEPVAKELWLTDLNNPFRWTIRPILQLLFAALLHVTWFIKRLPLPQFSAHVFLQESICWFCKYFVSPEANLLILRHYAAESNILNFMAVNSGGIVVIPLDLYPQSIDDMRESSFVKHDQELFRLFRDMGHWQHPNTPTPEERLNWDNWKPINMDDFQLQRRLTQIVDFESAHALFMCLFCLLLTREEYRDAINGFNLDQSIAIRVGEAIGRKSLSEMAFNKYPLYLVGPWNLAQRFLMHGFFTEYLYAELESFRTASSLAGAYIAVSHSD